jgi:Protein of unknown function (DUF4240)
MDETEFWEIVDSAREAAGGDPEEHADLVVERLTRLDPESVVDFARHFESRFNRAYRWDFEGAVHDPDTLAETVESFDPETDGDAEDLGYAADEAYEQLTGVRLPDLGLPEQPAEPEGAYIDFENTAAIAERFPRLWERFG